MGNEHKKKKREKDEEDIILEGHIIGHSESLSKEQTKKIFEQMDNSVCKIIKAKATGTGFICLIPFPNKLYPLSVLITCYHVLSKDDLKPGKEIKLMFDEKEKIIKINQSRKIFTSNENEYDISIIELLPEDNFDLNNLLEIENDIFKYDNLNDIYKNKSIYIIHYPEGKEPKYSVDTISFIDMDNIEMGHFCDTMDGSSGGPILNLNTYKVLGVHTGKRANNKVNIGKILKHPIYDFQKKYLNNINQKVPNIYLKNNTINNNTINNNTINNNTINNNTINNNIKNIHKKEDSNRKIDELINKENDIFKEDKRNRYLKDIEDDSKKENKKEIKEYSEIKIIKDIISCSYLNEFKDIGFDISLLKMDQLYINLIYFDLNLTKGEQYKYFSNFQLDVIGGFYAMDDLYIFEEYLKELKKINIPFIVISSGSSGKDIISICKIYSFIKEIIIFCRNYEYNKHYIQEYPGYVNKVFTDINSVYDYLRSFSPQKYKKENEIEEFQKNKHFIFSQEDIIMSKKLESNPVISAYVYDKCLFLVHRVYSYFFGDINDKIEKPSFTYNNYNKMTQFINNLELSNEDKNRLLKKLEEIKNKNNIAESSIRIYTGESIFSYLFNRMMRNAGKDLLSLVYYMGPFLYGLNKYVKENPIPFAFNKNLTLYRNIFLSKLDFYSYQINLNHIICFTSLTSTTLRRNKLYKNKNNKLIRLTMIIEYKHQPGNISPGIIVANNKGKENNEFLSVYPKEEEVILFPFTFFKIKKIHELDEENTYEMNLEIINRQSYIEYTLKDNVEKRILFSEME